MENTILYLHTNYLTFPGRSHGVGRTHAASQYSRTAGVLDDWDREREKHQRTLNGTGFTSAGTSRQQPATQSWPCVDNTSCEIQLSLVEQQQKLLNQKRQAPAKLQTSSHAGLRNGHSDTRMHSMLGTVDNRRVDDNKYVCSDTSIHSKSQRELMYGSEFYRGVGSRDGWTSTVGDFNPDMTRSSRIHANVPSHKPPSPDIPATQAMLDKKHVEEREFDASEEQTRKKLKRLQQLRSSNTSGKVHCTYFMLVLPYTSAE